MIYRPNFCAECGERVLRPRWRWWTSRRFCQACALRLRRRRVGARLTLCASLLALGCCVGLSVRRPAPPLVVVRGGAQVEEGSRDSGEAGGRQYGADGTAAERPTEAREVVSICGARTQKGAPCSRRVRGAGRCWQHRGKPAMLPPEKLVVPG